VSYDALFNEMLFGGKMKKEKSFESRVEEAKGLLMADESTFRNVYDAGGMYSGKKITDTIISDLVRMLESDRKKK
jgi:hypothetical protein